MNELQRLARATAATRKRFENVPFDWRRAATCIHLVRYHASKAGHKLPKVPRIRSALAAKRVLKEMGHESLCDLMDAHFERIPPAFLRVGDVMAVEGDQGLDALWIRVSPTKFFGWHDAGPNCEMIYVDLSLAIGAWRI
jgi:hypothetical protein